MKIKAKFNSILAKNWTIIAGFVWLVWNELPNDCRQGEVGSNRWDCLGSRKGHQEKPKQVGNRNLNPDLGRCYCVYFCELSFINIKWVTVYFLYFYFYIVPFTSNSPINKTMKKVQVDFIEIFHCKIYLDWFDLFQI